MTTKFFAPRIVTAYQLFQTPATLAARMAELAQITRTSRVLEPSAGLGRILRSIQDYQPATLTACENSPDCARELFAQFPDVTLWQGDFLTREGKAEFDRVVMNPPFHLRDDIRHTRHALTHLAPGGRLVGLCLATHHRETALRPLAETWETIPAGTFKAEGTNVETFLFTINKLTP
jgi:16S rRNA G1207 methylase RsmC